MYDDKLLPNIISSYASPFQLQDVFFTPLLITYILSTNIYAVYKYILIHPFYIYLSEIVGLVVNGFINVVITTIERRFGLRSSQTGLVASGYDIASFVCLVPVTYFGGRLGASKPRWLGWGVVIMGLGSLTFALPHFLVGTYRASSATSNVCVNGNGTFLKVTIKLTKKT